MLEVFEAPDLWVQCAQHLPNRRQVRATGDPADRVPDGRRPVVAHRAQIRQLREGPFQIKDPVGHVNLEGAGAAYSVRPRLTRTRTPLGCHVEHLEFFLCSGPGDPPIR